MVGQFGSEIMVYSGVRSCRRDRICHILLPLLSRGSVPPGSASMKPAEPTTSTARLAASLAFGFAFGHGNPSLFGRVYVRGTRVSTRFVCPRITGPPRTFNGGVIYGCPPRYCKWF